MNTPTDSRKDGVDPAVMAQAWRNRFVRERCAAYRKAGVEYELARANAESDANQFEDELIAALAARSKP